MGRKNHETRLQFVVVDYLHRVLPRDALFWHCPNGGKMSLAWRKMLGGLGVQPGASDLMLVYDGRFYAIELKTEADDLLGIPKTYQKPEQKAFVAQIVRAGGFYAVCRSKMDVRDVLAHWGIPTRETARSTPSMGAVG